MSTEELDTKKILADFNKRSEEAFKNLFDHFYAQLCFYASRFIEDQDEVKDIVQNVFVKIFNKSDLNFENVQALNSYLYSSVRNACINLIRQENLHRDKHEKMMQEAILEDEYMQEELETEVMTEIFRAIDRLPERCRDVFKLGYHYGYSNQEIAEELNISVNTVKTQKMRAKKILKEQLKNVFHIVIFLRMGF